MDTYLIKILGSNNTIVNSQISEAYTAWPASIDICLKRATHFKAMKDKIGREADTANILEDIHESISKLEPLLRDSSDVEKEGFSQVLFEGIPWSEINYIPFALVLVSFLNRIWYLLQVLCYLF